MSDSINGWTPPLVYDVNTDTKRIATQTDIDLMVRDISILGSFYRRISTEIDAVSKQLTSPGGETK